MTALRDISTVLRVGRYEIESHEVGTVATKILAGEKVRLTLVFDVPALEFALDATGLDVGPPQGKAQRVQAALDALRTNLVAEWGREWLTRTLLANAPVDRMTDAEFLRWAEHRSDDLDRWLGVPSVQAKIRSIRERGSRAQRDRLAQVVSGATDGRPKRLPESAVVYQWVDKAEHILKISGLADLVLDGRHGAVVWRELSEVHPDVAALLDGLGLRDPWFTKRERPHTQKRSLRYIACEFVAAREGFTVATIVKVAGRVAAQKRANKPV
jgi:hypothetical protein